MADRLSRAERFAKRLRGEKLPVFRELASPPGWQGCEGAARRTLAAIMALLAARPAIDGELSGPRLAELAAAVGEDRFDRLCDIDAALLALPDTPMSLPSPRDLARRGEELLLAAENRADIARMAELAHAIGTADPVDEARAA